MKRKIILLVCALGFVAATAFASGDQNCIRHRGGIGHGNVIQHQVRVNQ